MAENSKDSQSKQFGTTFLTKLDNQLDKKAPVFGQSLFAGAGNATRSAWDAGSTFARGLNRSGGFNDPMRSAMNTLGNSQDWLGGAARNSSNLLGSVYGGYTDLGDNNGLTGSQASALMGTEGLGSKYGALGTAYDPNSSAYKTLRQGIVDDTLSNLGSQFTSSGRFGGGSYIDTASQGLGDALAGLDYTNMQSNINNQYRALDSQRGVLGDVFNMGQTGVGNQMGALAGQAGAANSMFGNEAAAINGAQAAASSLFNMGQTGVGNQQSAVDLLTQIGAAQDANAQGALLGKADLFDRTKNAELDRLAKMGAIFGDPTAAANEPNWLQQGLGALLGFGGSLASGGAFNGRR